MFLEDVQFGRAVDWPPVPYFGVTGLALLVWWWRLVQLAGREMPSVWLRLRVAVIAPLLLVTSVVASLALAALIVYVVLLVRVFLR